MNMKIMLRTIPLIWTLAGLFPCLNATAEEPKGELIGRAYGVERLDVSPNGKWLLTWDGVTTNTPSTSPGQRLVWNLATKKSRDLSEGSRIYDQDCGWTPDNRIWNVHDYPHPAGDEPPPYTPTIYLQNPDGKKGVVCEDSDPKFAYDEESYFDEKADMVFSADGSRLYLLTNSYFRIFDTRNGKMLSRRKLAPLERSMAFLSPDGSTILAIQGMKTDYESGKVLDSGKWWLFNAKKGRPIRQLKAPAKVRVWGLNAANLVSYQKGVSNYTQGITWFYARLSDLKIMWSGTSIAPPEFLNAPGIFTIRDGRNGQERKFEVLVDNWRNLKTVTISPDRKTFYALDLNNQIFRFPTHELTKTNNKISP